jgi:hypothetical protein
MSTPSRRRVLEEVDLERRRFFGTAATVLATTWLGAGTWADPHVNARRTPDVREDTVAKNPAFGTLKHIDDGC